MMKMKVFHADTMHDAIRSRWWDLTNSIRLSGSSRWTPSGWTETLFYREVNDENESLSCRHDARCHPRHKGRAGAGCSDPLHEAGAARNPAVLAVRATAFRSDRCDRCEC